MILGLLLTCAVYLQTVQPPRQGILMGPDRYIRMAVACRQYRIIAQTVLQVNPCTALPRAINCWSEFKPLLNNVKAISSLSYLNRTVERMVLSDKLEHP